jgi:AraC-like DNA-binding protein
MRTFLLLMRSRLIADAKNVAAVGFDVGYDNPSQFSREYRRLFGVPPGEDMKRMRTDAMQGERLA